jgi:hypothetical protein
MALVAALAQLVEHRIRNAGATGSSPVSGTIFHIKIRYFAQQLTGWLVVWFCQAQNGFRESRLSLNNPSAEMPMLAFDAGRDRSIKLASSRCRVDCLQSSRHIRELLHEDSIKRLRGYELHRRRP